MFLKVVKGHLLVGQGIIKSREISPFHIATAEHSIITAFVLFGFDLDLVGKLKRSLLSYKNVCLLWVVISSEMFFPSLAYIRRWKARAHTSLFL